MDSSIGDIIFSGHISSSDMNIFHFIKDDIRCYIGSLFVFTDKVKLIIEVKIALRIGTSPLSLSDMKYQLIAVLQDWMINLSDVTAF